MSAATDMERELRDENERLLREAARLRRLNETTADHLRKARKRNRVLADLNEALSADVARWWGNEDPDGAANAPRHYRGDGRVTCRRAMDSAASQLRTDYRSEAASYWWRSAFKYVWRMWSKLDARKDAEKAIDCLRKCVQEMGL